LLGALASTESWLADSLVGKLDVPPELAGAGEIASGYRTAWGQGELAAPAVAPPLREVVASVFSAHDWQSELIGDALLCTTIEGETSAWRFLVRVDEARQLCALSSIHPEQVPEARRGAVAAELAARNRDVEAGAFDIDMNDGEVRLRSTLFAGDDGLSRSAFERSALANLEAFEAQLDELTALFRESP
jgi:hypothetical protein